MTLDQTTTLVNLVVQVLVLLGIIAIPAAYAYIVPRLPHNVQMLVRRLAADAVASVEQTAGDLQGTQKRAAATQQIVEALAGLGFKNIPPALISTALESAVYGLKQDMQLAQPAPVVVNNAQPAQQPEPVPATPPAK